jgi:hypothetical protein
MCFLMGRLDLKVSRALLPNSIRIKTLVMRPKFLIRPKMGPTMLKSGSSWNLVSLPASNTKGGERGMLKAPGLD